VFPFSPAIVYVKFWIPAVRQNASLPALSPKISFSYIPGAWKKQNRSRKTSNAA
jgi:hypothetical protein